jgi:hypothetical protein
MGTDTPPLPLPLQFTLGQAVYLTGEDHLRVRSLNSAAGVTLAVEGRQFTVDNVFKPFRERHVPNTNRTAATSTFHLGEGWLVDLQVRASGGTPRRGECFVVVELIRGFTGDVQPATTLIQGYVLDTSSRAWPASPLELSTEGPGNLRTITGTDPGAGVEITETVPTNARWRLIGMGVNLVTDATAGNRTVTISVDGGGTAFAAAIASLAQTATQTTPYFFAEYGVVTAVAQVLVMVPLPTSVLLSQGGRIKTLTIGLVAGDNWGAPTYEVEEWIED